MPGITTAVLLVAYARTLIPYLVCKYTVSVHIVTQTFTYVMHARFIRCYTRIYNHTVSAVIVLLYVLTYCSSSIVVLFNAR